MRLNWTQVAPLLIVVAAPMAGACSPSSETQEQSQTPASTSSNIKVVFDYTAAERMVEAIERPSLSEAEARALLENRGIAAMVTKTGVFSPSSTPESFVSDMRSFVQTRRYPTGDFALDWIYKYRNDVRKLVSRLRAGEEAMRGRMVQRLSRYAPRTDSVTATVYFVAGGLSDGFVLDGDPELAMFVALEKASGDVGGVEQNVTHELYHALQKASMAKTAAAVTFAATLSAQPPVQQLLATTLWEGTANFVADARETQGNGPYALMWRDRYVRNLMPERIRQSFQGFDSVLVDLEQGRIDWNTAYDRGFTGNTDSRFYFVGMEMAGALASARGPRYFDSLFVRPPTQFFRDYVALTDADSSLPRFAATTRRVIEQLPASW